MPRGPSLSIFYARRCDRAFFFLAQTIGLEFVGVARSFAPRHVPIRVKCARKLPPFRTCLICSFIVHIPTHSQLCVMYALVQFVIDTETKNYCFIDKMIIGSFDRVGRVTAMSVIATHATRTAFETI